MWGQRSWLVLLLLLGTMAYAVAETITVSTYYPSPRAVYQDLRSHGKALFAMRSGEVGVGIDAPVNPDAKLHIIQEGSAPAFRVDDQQLDPSPFVVDASGNVGIGTGVPASRLEIVGSPAGVGGVLHVTDHAGQSLLHVPDGGRLGIGTTDPQATVHIQSPANSLAPALRFQRANPGAQTQVIEWVEEETVRFTSGLNGGEYRILATPGGPEHGLVVSRDGDVGIGLVPFPGNTLDVNGKLVVRSGFGMTLGGIEVTQWPRMGLGTWGYTNILPGGLTDTIHASQLGLASIWNASVSVSGFTIGPLAFLCIAPRVDVYVQSSTPQQLVIGVEECGMMEVKVTVVAFGLPL